MGLESVNRMPPKRKLVNDPKLFSTVGGCNDKNTSTGAKVFGGYQFNQYAAAEVSYVNLGKFTIFATGTSVARPLPPVEAQAKRISIDAVGTWPITQSSVWWAGLASSAGL